MSEVSITNISVDLIDDPEFQVREVVIEDKLQELMHSINQYGVIQPIVVEKHDNRYRVVAGSLRLLSCRKMNLPTIPCIVRQFNKKERYEVTLHENLKRSDMLPMELARSLHKLKEEFGYTNKELGEKVGKSDGWVSNHFQLLRADPEIMEAVDKKIIDVTSANALMRLPARALRLRYLEFCQRSGASQALVREWVDRELAKKPAETPPSATGTTVELPETPPPLTFNCSCCQKEIDQNREIDLALCGECYDLVNEMMKAVRKGGG